MLGSIFRLKAVHFDEREHIWVVQLILCSENDYDLKGMLDYMKTKIPLNTNLLSLGHLLRKMNKTEKAEKYILQALDSLDAGDSHMCECYHELGKNAKAKDDHSIALLYHQKELSLKFQLNTTGNVDIGKTYGCIGNVYYAKRNFKVAMEYYSKALNQFLETVGHYHMYTAMLITILATLLECSGNLFHR
ncbi:unnamed protein product [Didymodactylos carnosus]|uniref:Uncharacterized protein n=1 Tax=Didymodactylos carnosus TaxID=1234261 RepID=A0A8S2CYA8_9BILA|nr:unnamed protein product [Didymodactylos carnosus]CAF3616846.1 unnamed protein product [Didymodactylos carnosus]